MKYLILTFSVILLATSCAKVTTPTTRQEILMGGSWKVSSLSAYSIFSGTPHDTTTIAIDTAACYMDDYFSFGVNNGGTLFTGNRKCSSTEPDKISIFWEMYNDNNNVRIYNAGPFFASDNSIEASVISLSTNQMVLKYNVIVDFPDTPASQTIVYHDTAKFTLTLTR